MSTNSPMKFHSGQTTQRKMHNRKTRIALACASILFCAVSYALPQKPVPPRLVNDFAGVFTQSQAMQMERVLTAFDDSTSNQIAVVTVTDLEGYTPSEYATRIGLEWQVGSEKFDNGIVVLVKPKTSGSNGEVAIAVGYGLEGAIPDVYAKRIIENEMIPHFRENDYFAGTASACTVLMQLASGEISEVRERDGENGIPAGVITLLFLFFIIFTVIASKAHKGGDNNGGNGGSHGMDPDDIASAIIIGSLLGGGRGSRHSGGWGSSSGGFGGGFGGFGGGSFGGGGASGSW